MGHATHGPDCLLPLIHVVLIVHLRPNLYHIHPHQSVKILRSDQPHSYKLLNSRQLNIILLSSHNCQTGPVMNFPVLLLSIAMLEHNKFRLSDLALHDIVSVYGICE